MWSKHKEDEFAKLLTTHLSPSHPIQSLEFLKGRDAQLKEIERSWPMQGRQFFVYGYRGVGKTSLAQTAAFRHQSADTNPILLNCSSTSTCFELIRDLCAQAIPSDPRLAKQIVSGGAEAKMFGLALSAKGSEELGKIPVPTSTNEAVQMLEFLASKHSKLPVVIIDEFDLLTNKTEHENFASLVKQIGDRGIPIKLIFCGIGDSLDELFQAHDSTYRYFHVVKVDRLGFEPRCEIITSAAKALGITIDTTTVYRIAKISDGFPHFIHLVCEKLFWVVYEDPASNGRATADHYEEAVNRAVEAIEAQLKRPYEMATRKYSNDYEPVLWALADNHELQRPSREIHASYLRIMEAMNKEPLKKSQFHNRMNNMKKPAYGAVLVASRAGWYEFKEKMLRGYARLRAAQSHVDLEIDHPLQARRFPPQSQIR